MILSDDVDAVNRLLDACVKSPIILKQVNKELGGSGDKLTLRIIGLIRDAMELDSVTSMEQSVGEEEDMELGDMLPSKSPSPEKQVMDADLKEQLILALRDTLDPRRAFIVIAKFGLDRNEDRTLEEVGSMTGITRERVRQIVQKALKTMREKHPELVTLLAGGAEMFKALRHRDFLENTLPQEPKTCVGCGGERDVPGRSRCKLCTQKYNAAWRAARKAA